jgi:hypothetical protein
MLRYERRIRVDLETFLDPTIPRGHAARFSQATSICFHQRFWKITACDPPEIHRSAGKSIPLGFQEPSIDFWVFNTTTERLNLTEGDLRFGPGSPLKILTFCH